MPATPLLYIKRMLPSRQLLEILVLSLLLVPLALVHQAAARGHGSSRGSLLPVKLTPERFYDAAVDRAKAHRHNWRQRPREYSILFLTTFVDYVQEMDRYFYDLVEAAERHPGTTAVVWGPGFPGWNPNKTVGVNVYRRYACQFSFLYFHNGNRGLKVGARSNIEPCDQQMTVIEEMHDCHRYYCKSMYDTGKASDIVTARYAFVPLELFDKNDPNSPTSLQSSTVKLLAHNPDCADPRKIQPLYFKEKTGKAFLLGSIERNLYPLRMKIFTGIKDHNITSIDIYKHPGYWFGFLNQTMQPEHYSATSAISSRAAVQYNKYVNTIVNAHICVFDSSVVRKTIKKFMEAMMAGCVVASDIPMDMLGTMHDLLVPLSLEMTTKEIDWAVASALKDVDRLQDFAARGIHYALQHFTCEAKFDRLLDIYESYLAGNYGYYFPYGFQAGCGHHYVQGRNPNWWCFTPQ